MFRYVKGRHNIKAGVTLQHTFLTEDDKLGIVDPTFWPRLDARAAIPRPIRAQFCCRST